MKNAEKRVLKNYEQILGLEKLGFDFERRGFSDCMLPWERTPSIKPTDIYKNSMGLTLIIVYAGGGFSLTINNEELERKYHYHNGSKLRNNEIVGSVIGYLKIKDYPVPKEMEDGFPVPKKIEDELRNFWSND